MKPLIIGTILVLVLLHGLFPPAVAYLIGAIFAFAASATAFIVAYKEGDLVLTWEKADG